MTISTPRWSGYRMPETGREKTERYTEGITVIWITGNLYTWTAKCLVTMILLINTTTATTYSKPTTIWYLDKHTDKWRHSTQTYETISSPSLPCFLVTNQLILPFPYKMKWTCLQPWKLYGHLFKYYWFWYPVIQNFIKNDNNIFRNIHLNRNDVKTMLIFPGTNFQIL